MDKDKKSIVNLVRLYAEKNDKGFKNEVYKIIKDYESTGYFVLAEYLMALITGNNVFVPQDTENEKEE